MNWFDKTADAVWVERVGQEYNAWAQHNQAKFGGDEPYIYRPERANGQNSLSNDSARSYKISLRKDRSAKGSVESDNGSIPRNDGNGPSSIQNSHRAAQQRRVYLKSPFEEKNKDKENKVIKAKESITSSQKKLFYPKQQKVDPDGIESESDDDIMYPGMGKTKIRLAKIKKRDEEIASQVFLGNKGRKIFKKTQSKNPTKVG